MKKLFYLLLTVLIIACSSDDSGNACVYTPVLTTSATTNITDTSATLNGTISVTSENCDAPNNTEQGFVFATTIQPTTNDNQVNVNGVNVTTTIENLQDNTTYYVRTFLTNALGEFYGNEVSFLTSETPDTTAPVITLIGDASVSVFRNTNYVDAGAIATDNVDGDLTSSIVTTGSVDVTTIGIYTITYSVSDAAGNSASVSREVSVIDYPVYLDTNGITVKARESAIVGQWYRLNGVGMEYLVVDEDLLRSLMGTIGGLNTPVVTTKISDMTSMHAQINISNLFIGSWDVSNVTNMQNMFARTPNIAGDISNWDVSNVTDMSYMFYEAPNIQDLANWDVSNVTDMKFMLYRAENFNSDIGNWDVSHVTDMAAMFEGASAFNQNINNWDVSNVSDMRSMFQEASVFNQNINNWDVSNVTGMEGMFQGAVLLNQDLSFWNVGNVIICTNFSSNTPQWTLPKPNFTNCNP